MLCRHIYLNTSEVRKLKIPSTNLISVDITRLNYIKICSILDELTILNKYAKDDNYLKDTLYIIAPLSRALKKYTGFRKGRNSIYAHFNRNKKNEFYPFWKVFENSNFPKTEMETNKVYTYLHGISGILVTRYYDEFMDYSDIQSKDLELFKEWQNQQILISPDSDYYSEIDIEIDKRMKEYDMKGIIVDPIMEDLIKYFKNN